MSPSLFSIKRERLGKGFISEGPQDIHWGFLSPQVCSAKQEVAHLEKGSGCVSGAFSVPIIFQQHKERLWCSCTRQPFYTLVKVCHSWILSFPGQKEKAMSCKAK